MRLMLSLLILFLVSNANGNNGEEEANRQRELHPRTHTHTSCSYTKIRTAMFDCLDKALNRERPPVNLTSEYEKSVYGPGDVMPYEDYTDDVHTKVCDGGAALNDCLLFVECFPSANSLSLSLSLFLSISISLSLSVPFSVS